MKQDKEKALFIARKMFAELVFDVQRLEGMPFTMPEVQTYLQGITVGGHKISDEEKLKQQILAWEKVIELVKCEEFTLTRETAFLLQTIIAKDEALEVGRFRSGGVGIQGTDYTPPKAERLEELFSEVINNILTIQNICAQAYQIHLDFARSQFFYDGNKRTGLLMANGHLLTNGYPPLSIPAKRLTEYNAGMIRFYDNGDYSEMMAFLKECHQAMYRKFE